MAIDKENDLVSPICIVKILYREFLRYTFCEMYFVFGCAKNLEPYYFFMSFHTNSAIT